MSVFKSTITTICQFDKLLPYQLAMWLNHAHQTCALCQHSLGRHDRILCQNCLQSLSPRPPALLLPVDDLSTTQIRLHAASYYQYPVNRLILQYKDHQNGAALLSLVRLIQTLPKPKQCHAHNTVIIPAPTTKTRLQNRGFDPVLTLAKHLSKHWQLPIFTGLVRLDDARHQRGLDRQARLQNLGQKFYLTKPLPCRQLILFDDVATTGATMQAMARAVLANCADVRMMAVCLAHGSQGA